ncbi:MAG: hypothetical protein HYX68_09490 [Planctomycetes bacterium]|nr:hypothetical protein [Planctomycetota bacterium]
MNCLDCQDLLQKRLDGDPLGNGEALEQHLNQCAPCRETHAAAALLLETLPRIAPPGAPADFARTVTAEVLRDRRVRLAKMRRRVWVTAALAASVLMMLFAAYWWLPRTAPEEPQQPFVKLPPKIDPPKKILVPPPKMPEPRNGFASLTERMADTTRDHAKVVLVAASLDGVEKLPAVNDLPMLDGGVREAGQEVSDGVRAVARNARKALDFFAREMPMP